LGLRHQFIESEFGLLEIPGFFKKYLIDELALRTKKVLHLFGN